MAARDSRVVVGLVVAAGAVLLGSAVIQRVGTQQNLNYELSEAVARNNVNRVNYLLRAGADSNAPYSGYKVSSQVDRLLHPHKWRMWTVLWGARLYGKTEIANILVKHGAR